MRIVYIGNLPYNLEDVNDQIKLYKLEKSFPEIIPPWIKYYLKKLEEKKDDRDNQSDLKS